MTTTQELQAQSPTEIDAKLFPALAERWLVQQQIQKNTEYLSYEGTRQELQYGLPIKHAKRDLPELQERLDKAEAIIQTLQGEYERRGGWARYVIVVTRDGHVHDHHCPSFRPTTQVCWIPQASGLERQEVVDRFGYTACTRCFPDAPVAPKPSDPNTCPGSGVYQKTEKPHAKYVRCQECGKLVARTGYGYNRKHSRG